MTCEKILVPVDFSDDSDHALDYAIDLAQQFQSVLALIHVIHMHLPHVVEASYPNIMEYMRTEAEAQINRRRQRAKGAGMRASAIVEPGMPATRIIEVAWDQDVDLIVMGTHGRSGLHRILLGSVAERVVGLSHCPVLTVPRSDAAL
ncbi:MAG: universal stress protein [Candidatus Tectomicrobia bacterium]|nr:universal stress protein [Candidatus Tectomicrobia bacterium]